MTRTTTLLGRRRRTFRATCRTTSTAPSATAAPSSLTSRSMTATRTTSTSFSRLTGLRGALRAAATRRPANARGAPRPRPSCRSCRQLSEPAPDPPPPPSHVRPRPSPAPPKHPLPHFRHPPPLLPRPRQPQLPPPRAGPAPSALIRTFHPSPSLAKCASPSGRLRLVCHHRRHRVFPDVSAAAMCRTGGRATRAQW